MMIRIDVHQHLWSTPLVEALTARRELPFIRQEGGLTVLYLAGERPYVIDLASEAPSQRGSLVELDGLDRALLCISSPLGIERLERPQALTLIDAYHDGALSLDDSFGVWAAIALDRMDPSDVDRALARGCVGVSLPSGALENVDGVAAVRPLLARIEALGVPLLVHPGPGLGLGHRYAGAASSFSEPLWWPAMNGYVASMHSAWHAFLSAGRPSHPRLRVVFTMLAGLAPLHVERLSSRGGPAPVVPDPLIFYDTSSYGPDAVRCMEAIVGAEQLLYGSDRPVVEPGVLGMPEMLDWDAVGESTRRAFGPVTGAER